jgi:hypothetical protein
MSRDSGQGERIASRSREIGQSCVPQTVRLEWRYVGAVCGLFLMGFPLWIHNGVGTIGGLPKSCKSWMGLDMAVSVASRTESLAEFVRWTTRVASICKPPRRSPLAAAAGRCFNMAGEVVGITTMYLKDGENLNFAIPINDAKRLLATESLKIQGLPDESETMQGQASDGVPPPSAGLSARDYYKQLYDAGGVRNGFVCFNDDTSATGFFTFLAFAYDEKHPHGDGMDRKTP